MGKEKEYLNIDILLYIWTHHEAERTINMSGTE